MSALQRVTSLHNPRLKEAGRLLTSSRDRRKAGQCVLEGEHVVTVAAQRLGTLPEVIVTEDALTRPEVRALAQGAHTAIVVSPALFAQVTLLPVAIGIIAIVPAPRATPKPDAALSLLLEDVQDPGNVGTMLRTAAAAGADQVLLSPTCAFAWSPKVLRAGQGAHFQLAIAEDVELAPWSRDFAARGGRVLALVAQDGASLYDTSLVGRLALVVGNEGAGLTHDLRGAASGAVTIPMPGGTESLNAAAAAAVCLFEAVRQRTRAG